ncbi:MAG: PAS domain S-box protein, partial [Nitrospirae bacterium]
MTDLFLEVIRATITAGIFFYLLTTGKRSPEISEQKGWGLILLGFGLVLFGTVVDITDNFPSLNRFYIIGDTPQEAFLEKAIGYTCGTIFIFLGFLQWFPMVFRLKRQEKLIAQQEMIYRQSVENASIAVFSIDTEEKIYSWNRACETLFGYSKEETTGKPFKILIPDERTYASLKEKIGHVLKGQSFSNLELVLLARDGTEKNLLVTLTPVYNPEMEIVRCAFACVDITEKVKLQEEMERINRMDSLSVLAGGIAHDFNNLLTGIIGNISLARSKLTPGTEPFQRLSEAEKACDTAQALVKEILLFARGSEPEKRVIDLKELLKENVKFIFRSTDIETEVSLEDGLWNIEADPAQINQAIQNILINAKEAVEGKKGRVTVKAENVVDEKEGRFVRISIQDNGPGIPEEIIPRIFEPFFTTKTRGNTKGTGLGLSIAHTVVTRHGGRITVKNSDGSGAEFTLLLPATDKEPDRAQSTEPSTEWDTEQPSGIRVLVMDDEEVIRDVVSE